MFEGVASVVTHALTVKGRPGRSTLPPWGDGFVGLPLATLWYPRSWCDVSDDELVLFLPHLTERDDPQFGIAARLGTACNYRNRVAEGLYALSGNASELRAQPLTVEERAAAERLPFDCDRPLWAREAAILDAIGHMLRHARYEVEDTPSLAVALLASIHTGINAAYVYPTHTCAHEILAAGAWLGVLLKGRRAIFPEALARVFVESESRTQPGIVDDMMRFHMECLGGRNCFVREARKAIQAKRQETIVDYAP